MSSLEKRYKVILTEPRMVGDEMMPSGSVINIIIWDGTSSFTLEAGTRLEEESS